MPPFPMAHVATITADGRGHFSGEGTENVDGVSFPDTLTGTYTVSPECAVSLVIADTVMGQTINGIQVGVITGEGQSQELRSIIGVPGFVFAYSYKPQ